MKTLISAILSDGEQTQGTLKEANISKEACVKINQFQVSVGMTIHNFAESASADSQLRRTLC